MPSAHRQSQAKRFAHYSSFQRLIILFLLQKLSKTQGRTPVQPLGGPRPAPPGGPQPQPTPRPHYGSKTAVFWIKQKREGEEGIISKAFFAWRS